MAFVADTHVHLYPVHDLALALRGAMARLGALAPDLPRVLCLTERQECRFFRDHREGGLKLPTPFSIANAGDHALVVLDNAGGRLFLVAGRQIATRERLEVHCIGRDAGIPDGLPLRDAIQRVREADGVAVLPWGVGKWLGKRGQLVADALADFPDVFAGDSSLRPAGWPEPVLTQFPGRVVWGSDPLPAPGEEDEAGCYVTIVDAPFDERDPAAALLAALRGGVAMKPAGRRCGPLEVWHRLRNMRKAAR